LDKGIILDTFYVPVQVPEDKTDQDTIGWHLRTNKALYEETVRTGLPPAEAARRLAAFLAYVAEKYGPDDITTITDNGPFDIGTLDSFLCQYADAEPIRYQLNCGTYGPVRDVYDMVKGAAIVNPEVHELQAATEATVNADRSLHPLSLEFKDSIEAHLTNHHALHDAANIALVARIVLKNSRQCNE
jgi:hypothetical protein